MRLRWMALPVFAALTAAAAGPEVCGYIYDIRGDWRLGPQFAIKLERGMELHPGDKIKAMNARPAHIDVGLLNGTLWKQNCATENDCRDAVTLPGTPAGPTLSERLRNLISGFGSHPTPVVFTLSRGGEGEPTEAVLPLSGDRADLAPAIKSMGGRAFQAKLIATHSEKASASVECRSDKPGCFVPGVAPGLYKLEVTVPDREPQTVAVLVASGSNYRSMDETFAEARRVADSWGPSTHPTTRHYFLTATLTELARTSSKADHGKAQ